MDLGGFTLSFKGRILKDDSPKKQRGELLAQGIVKVLDVRDFPLSNPQKLNDPLAIKNSTLTRLVSTRG
jgi:hypothetical protein